MNYKIVTKHFVRNQTRRILNILKIILIGIIITELRKISSYLGK